MMVTQLRSIQEIHRFVDNLVDVNDHSLPDLKNIQNFKLLQT